MRSLTAVFIVSAGLIASAQTTVPSSNSVPATPAANTYQLAPPNVALPGSGTPTGAPVRSDVNINDARSPQGGAVFQPASVGGTPIVDSYRVSTPSMTAEGAPSAAGTSIDTTGASEPVTGDGMRNFSAAAPGALANTKSLADLAAEHRGNRPGIGKRSFNNSDIAAMGNSVGNEKMELPQGDEAAPTAPNAGGPYTTESGEQVLDRKDYDAVEAALARHAGDLAQSDESTTAQNQNPQNGNAQQQAGANDSDRKTIEQAQPEANPSSETQRQADMLPQTSSALPLLGLLGAGAITFGMVFRNARRSF
jgi:hypothetical protein